MNTLRANLYLALAEVLAEPPDWLMLDGRKWPLFEAALQLAEESEAARLAVVAMIEIGAESRKERQARYAGLFAGPGRPNVWLYESEALQGQLHTEVTLEVEQWYRAAGMSPTDGDLPDHASMELAFLAQLAGAQQEGFDRFEKEFLERHALRWLPALGRALAASGDLVYATVGHLLAGWLGEIDPRRPRSGLVKALGNARQVPALEVDEVDGCTLCGFCMQICPTKALVVRENDELTALHFSTKLCVGCGKCVRVCDPHVLRMNENLTLEAGGIAWKVLRQSARPRCKKCGKSMVSQAELNFVAERLGHPDWLDVCLDCRPSLF